MDKFIEEKLNSKEQEKRFLEWVNARDDDWWEDEARISIWDFRIMKEFFNEDFEQALSDAIKYGEEKALRELENEYLNVEEGLANQYGVGVYEPNYLGILESKIEEAKLTKPSEEKGGVNEKT